MTQTYCTGPASFYVGIGQAGAPLFLGWSETTPDLDHQPAFMPVMCDVSGQVHPHDDSYQGAIALVSETITRFNYSTLSALQDYTRRLGGLRIEGTDGEGAVGALMLQESIAYNLWVVWPYGGPNGKPAMRNLANGPLPPGRRYLAAYLVNDNLAELGTRPLKAQLVWKCMRRFTPSAKGGYHVLYDSSTSGLPPPN